MTPAEWWAERRLRYNIGLLVAGPVAFACYCVVVYWGSSVGAIQDAEISLFTTAFQAIGYCFMIAVANVLYYVGPLSERMIQPRNPDRFRVVAYRLGFWFSVILPFSVPLLLGAICLAKLGYFGS